MVLKHTGTPQGTNSYVPLSMLVLRRKFTGSEMLQFTCHFLDNVCHTLLLEIQDCFTVYYQSDVTAKQDSCQGLGLGLRIIG